MASRKRIENATRQIGQFCQLGHTRACPKSPAQYGGQRIGNSQMATAVMTMVSGTPILM